MADLTRAAGAPAGVSAEDLVAAIRVHVDRVHDAVRRIGCDPDAAVQVVEESAVDLVEVVAARPETVEDAVGWWFARARALGRRVATRSADLPLGGGVLAVDEDQEVLAEALEQLPERERVALLLRDSYDLPATSVGAALGTDADGAMELVGRARLAFLPLVDDEPAPAVPEHQADLGALARIGQGGQVAARDATVRRHALSCDGCRTATDAQQRAHLLLTGLTVVALPEADRIGVLARVEDQAFAALPSAASLVPLVEDEEYWDDDEDPRLFSPLLALLSLVVAVLLGLGLGLLLSRSGGVGSLLADEGRSPMDVELLEAPSPPPQVLVSPPVVQAPRPETTVFVIPPPPPPPPPPSPVEPTAVPAGDALALTVDPATGPNGAVVTVSGTGFTPGAQVTVDYLDPTGAATGSQTVVVADERGRFTSELTAQDPNNLPGDHVVRASDGTLTAEATYTAQA
ncbi:MAG: Neocarzinostatin family [Frankiales bacterium]|nr:Neocarzinostatin family [Frankiales bacterium]